MSKTYKPPFAIYRTADARDFEESGLMTAQPLGEVAAAGAGAAVAAGAMEGTRVRLLFSMPGLSLAHAWFKSGFPLPRHSHDTDCLYYIVAGGLKIGAETLGKGDGFFVGAGVPYTYTPGPEGVEVLEFRGSDAFDIRVLANNAAFWTKATEQVTARREAWASERPPGEATG